MSDVINLSERGGDPSVKMARLIMAAKTDPMRENTREEWLASSLLAAHDRAARFEAQRDGERAARENAQRSLAAKDEAMGELFKRLQDAGVGPPHEAGRLYPRCRMAGVYHQEIEAAPRSVAGRLPLGGTAKQEGKPRQLAQRRFIGPANPPACMPLTLLQEPFNEHPHQE